MATTTPLCSQICNPSWKISAGPVRDDPVCIKDESTFTTCASYALPKCNACSRDMDTQHFNKRCVNDSRAVTDCHTHLREYKMYSYAPMPTSYQHGGSAWNDTMGIVVPQSKDSMS